MKTKGVNNMRKVIKVIAIAFAVVIVAFVANIFEIDFGRCLNDDGDGKLYNGEPYYNYISYHYTDAQEDDIVMTFCINDRYGDCLERWDWVVLKNTKGVEG